MGLKTIRLAIMALDEDDKVIDRRGARYDIVDPQNYDIDSLAASVADTAAATFRSILNDQEHP